MINKEIIFGLFIGLTQGFLFQIFFVILFKYSAYFLSRILLSATIITIIGSFIACIGFGIFLICAFIPLMWVTVASIRQGYGLSWLIGFATGALIYIATHQNNNPRV